MIVPVPVPTNKTKKTQGRQKIEIKKLENKSNKQVTFSKRRAGLFKKAGELSVLCGAEVAVVVFSPNSKVFCFGHPSPESVIHRYMYGTATTNPPEAMMASELVAVGEFNREYGEAVEELEMEKKRAEMVKRTAAWSGRFWWEEEAVEGMRLEELEHFMAALKEMRRKVVSKTEELLKISTNSTAGAANATVLAAPPPSGFHGGFGGDHGGLVVVGGGGEDASTCFGFGFEGGEF